MSAAFPLSLHHLCPRPLRDRFASRSSELWLRDIIWDDQQQVFIQAPSGTGKTTLIHMLYGLRADYDGRISWGSSVLSALDAEGIGQLRRESVSIIFQDMRLFPNLTAWENLEVKRVLTNSVPVDEARAWMSMLGIADRADMPAATLSYGEQQRVAIIRALLQPFKWMLMDEPFSHLDGANASLAANLISDVVARNSASFLMVDLDDNAHFAYTQKLVL